MSRLAKKPIIIESGVNVSLTNGVVKVTGPKGELTIPIPDKVEVLINQNSLILQSMIKRSTSLIGLTRSLIQNAIIGTTGGWQKTLELVGTGFRAQTTGKELTLHLGFSHPITINAPQTINFQVIDNKVIVAGVDKYQVGEIAAVIRRLKPPEPYKGKGIRYSGEIIRKKLGKAAKAVGTSQGASK